MFNDRDQVRRTALPLEEEADLGPVLDRIGQAKVVFLGEASHGTHEYYAWRAALTRRLITDRGFSFVAVEGDWPDCWRVHRSVTGAVPDDPLDVLDAYRRWPTWMWANTETVNFCRWLRDHNTTARPGRQAGFYGLDVYSLWDSLRAITEYLAEHHPGEVRAAIAAYQCFEPYGEDPQAYAWETSLVPDGCASEVVDLLTRMRRGEPASDDPVERLNALQNAEVAAGAERYYRSMIDGSAQSWNVRDTHMADTLDRLLAFHGPDARAVVWAHNTHVGDARATPMAGAGMTNLGRLARDRYGSANVAIVGFASGHGEVIAAPRWGAPMEVMTIPPPQPSSLEALLTDTDLDRALFVFSDQPDADWLTRRRGHRAVGVVYDPDRDHRNFVPTVPGSRYDMLCWFKRTSALQPLHLEATRRGEFETLPSGI
jgi:erythromycin esterase-like protein